MSLASPFDTKLIRHLVSFASQLATNTCSGRVRRDLRERSADRAQEACIIERFHEKGKGSGVHHGSFSGRILVPGDKNRFRFRRLEAEVRQQFHPRHAIHPDVEDGNLHGIIRDKIEKQFRLTEGQDFKAIRFQQAPD